jgi:DNA replication and repair protein RecF
LQVDKLVLQNFRNYIFAETELSGGVNLVTGRNAQGKTNFLEAIHCLSGLGSPRAADAALVRDGADAAVLHALVTREGRSMAIDMEIGAGKGTRVLINKTPVAGARLLGALTTSVFFGPEELSLVKGSPERRRSFLDELVVKLRPAREGLRREWERVLKQRNALLKSARRGGAGVLATLEVWNESLCRVGAQLTAARLELLAALTPHVRKRYEAIAGAGRLELSYSSGWLSRELCEQALAEPASIAEEQLEAMLADALPAVRARELERGVSLVGPQRDDATVLLQVASEDSTSMLEARMYGSQGDQRTAALALKLAEHDLLSEALGAEPVLLLDDVFSELDPSRRAWLGDAVRGIGQTLVSSAEPGAIESATAQRVVEVVAGRLHASP